MDYVLNGPITYPSGGPAYKDGYIAIIMPRGVRSYYDPNIYTPFLGKGEMGCCPDLTRPDCADIINKNSACPVKTRPVPNSPDGAHEVLSIVPSPVATTESTTASRECKSVMCIELSRPPEKMGAMIDLMVHSKTVPLPLKFINIGKNPGSRVLFRKTHSYYYKKYIYSSSTNSSPTITAALDEGFYTGMVIGREHDDVPLTRQNRLLVSNEITGETEKIDAMACYVIDGWPDGNGITYQGKNLQPGSRVVDSSDNCPCIIIAINGFAGRFLANTSKTQLNNNSSVKVTLLTDLEQVRVVEISKIKFLPGLNVRSLLDNKTTAMRYNPTDIKYRYAYYYNIPNPSSVDPLFIIHNAGAGTSWQRVMEVRIDENFPPNTADVARNPGVLDMHTYMGIKNDTSDSTNFYSSSSVRLTKLQWAQVMMGNKYELRWSGDYLEIRAGNGAGNIPSEFAVYQVDAAIALETNILVNECKTYLGIDEDSESTECDSIRIDHIYGRKVERAITVRTMLEKCSSEGQLMSRVCMEAARRGTRSDVESLLGPAFKQYCSHYGKYDTRCEDATVFSFVSADISDSPDFAANYYYDWWPIALIVIVASAYYAKEMYFSKGNEREKAIQVLAGLTIASLGTYYAFPIVVQDAFVGLTRIFL